MKVSSSTIATTTAALAHLLCFAMHFSTCAAAGHTTADDFPGPENEYMAPGPDDVRSPCPAINLLANHGFIDRSGKEIETTFMYEQLATVFDTTVGFATTVGAGATALGLTDEIIDNETNETVVVLTIDRLFEKMAQQHDASFTRKDEFFGDDSIPVDLVRVNALLDGKDSVTKEDIMKAQVANIFDSRKTNPEFRFPEGVQNSMSAQATLFLAFGQDEDLTSVPASWLRDYMVDNKLPAGYKPLGLSNATTTTFPISFAPDSTTGMVRAEFKTSIVDAVEADLTTDPPGPKDTVAPTSMPSETMTSSPASSAADSLVQIKALLVLSSVVTAVLTAASG